ncbi:MAG: hypothetical protein E6Q99_08370 [Elusimicrobia bacterium]|nr:MAG: hypothetical protein E6Q99_08370 [Elusimicrobiota bacterium]
MRRLTIASAALAWAVAAGAGTPVEIMKFSSSDPAAWEDARDRRSAARPLTLEEIRSLARSGVKEKALVRMIRSRGAMTAARGEELAALKAQGVSDGVIEALSTHALAENRRIDVLLSLDVVRPVSTTMAPYLYVALVHEASGRQEELLKGALGDVLNHRWKVEEIIDRSDPLLPSSVRRIRLAVPFRATRHGKMAFKVLVTRRPGLTDLTRLPTDEAARVVSVGFDYPAVSLDNRCELDIELGQDPLLPGELTLKEPGLRTYWE